MKTIGKEKLKIGLKKARYNGLLENLERAMKIRLAGFIFDYSNFMMGVSFNYEPDRTFETMQIHAYSNFLQISTHIVPTSFI